MRRIYISTLVRAVLVVRHYTHPPWHHGAELCLIWIDAYYGFPAANKYIPSSVHDVVSIISK